MQGWGFPAGSRKAHYFGEDGMALCRGYGFYFGPVEDDKHDHPDNCTQCKKKKARLDNGKARS